MINQSGIEHTRQAIDLIDSLKNLAFVIGFQHNHQFAGGAFLMKLNAREQTQIGFHRLEQGRTGMYYQTGNVQRLFHDPYSLLN
ncbi:hypothetical protein EMIT0P291_80189 [Pseudomonas sp. IT-P291]